MNNMMRRLTTNKTKGPEIHSKSVQRAGHVKEVPSNWEQSGQLSRFAPVDGIPLT